MEQIKKPKTKILWYLAYEILYFEYADVTLQDDYLVWENLRLINAETPEIAYEKAIRYGKDSEEELEINESKGYCKFLGLKKLIPIYEDFEDGAEIEWKEYEVSKSKLAGLIVPKEELQAFTP